MRFQQQLLPLLATPVVRYHTDNTSTETETHLFVNILIVPFPICETEVVAIDIVTQQVSKTISMPSLAGEILPKPSLLRIVICLCPIV